MRIAIDALGIQNYGGGRTATVNLLSGLFTVDSQNDYWLFLSKREPQLTSGAGSVRQVIVPIKNRILSRLWAQLSYPIQFSQFDLAHFTKNLGVFGLKIPSIITVYDVTTLLHPELFPRFDVWYWKHIEKKILQHAQSVIAISEATSRDLQRIYSLPPRQVAMIYPSIDPRYQPAPVEEILRVRQKYHLPESYILHVGRIDVKKNLTLLVRAYASARKQCRINFVEGLVLVGEAYPKGPDLALVPTIDQLGLVKEVLFTRGVPDEDLPAIMSEAVALVSASVHEGFGLAPIEAMACGTPVLAYRAGALPEAVGKAAFLIDQLDQETLASAMIEVVTDYELRKDLSLRGMQRAQSYNREMNARKTLQLYEEVVHEHQKEQPDYTS